MRVSTPVLLFGCFLSVGFGCAKSDGSGGTGGSGDTGGSSATGGSASGGSTGTGGSNATGGSTGTGGNGSGTGGSVSTGGTTGTGGKATGGSTGTGGSSATGGSSGTGGSTGTGGTGTSCTITPTSSTSTKIGTVGIVTFTTTLSSPTAAQIDFGLDTSYGMTAPVSLTAAKYSTLLLGMKPSKTYHYRVSVTNASGTCMGGDNTIMTGPLPNGLPTQTITTNNASGLAGGFLVTGQYSAGGMAPAFIFDKDGAYVWAYTASGSDACGATMSYDGQYMYINNANVPDSTAHLHKVSMDGLTDVDLSTPFAHLSHQVTPLPDGSVAFYAAGSNGCDDIKIFPANGTASTTATTITNAKTAHGGTGSCHVNNIQYSSSDDTLVFSDLDNNVLTKVTKTGTAVWVLNGGVNGVTSSFNSGAIIWKGGEHGFHILPGDGSDLLIFNNNSKNPAGGGNWGSAMGDGSGALAIEVKLNVSAKTASQTWMYKANPGIVNDVLGDVQRLPNGNTMINFATKGTIQEIDASGTVLQQIKTSTNFGYIQKRPTLYGPPPR